jgi:hypothetical protein
MGEEVWDGKISGPLLERSLVGMWISKNFEVSLMRVDL